MHTLTHTLVHICYQSPLLRPHLVWSIVVQAGKQASCHGQPIRTSSVTRASVPDGQLSYDAGATRAVGVQRDFNSTGFLFRKNTLGLIKRGENFDFVGIEVIRMVSSQTLIFV